MTIQEALDMADELKPNMMQEGTKIRFLSELEGKIYHEIIMKHEHENMDMPVYDDETATDTELLAPAPYDMVYVYWLISRIDHMNQEMDKYNNDRILFENAWGELSDYWTREHMPLQPASYYIF